MVEALQRAGQALLFLQYQARVNPGSSEFQWPAPRYLLAAQDGLDGALYPTASDATDEYDRAFLKHLVHRTERAMTEASVADAHALGLAREDWVGLRAHQSVNESLLERYVKVLSVPQQGVIVGAPVPDPMRIHHYFPLDDGPVHPLLGACQTITLRDEGVAISQGTTGLTTWEASYRLGSHLVQEQHAWARPHERILELGSGAGFLGMLCARLLHADSTLALTDLEGKVLDRLHETARINGIHQPSVQITPLNWLEGGDPASSGAAYLRQTNATRILAADVVYDPSLVGPLAETLHTALVGNGAAARRPASAAWDASAPFALLSSTVRNPSTYRFFLDALEAHGMQLHPGPEAQTVWPHAPMDMALPLFPTAHAPARQGAVEMVYIQLQPR